MDTVREKALAINSRPPEWALLMRFVIVAAASTAAIALTGHAESAALLATAFGPHLR